MRKVNEQINDAVTKKAVVRRDVENDEYVVQFYSREVGTTVWAYHADADYHTDDKDDAIATALYVVSKP